LIIGCFFALRLQAQDAGGTALFDNDVPQKLMSVMRDGFTEQNPDQALAVFDGERMPNYALFANQVRALFSIYNNFRVFYRITDVAAADCPGAECGDATVQFSLEADRATGQPPNLSREAQLNIRFMREKKDWKIIELAPRELFR
jgi:hypothetical protein